MYFLNREVIAKAKNHTDNIDSVTLGNNSAFVNGLSLMILSPLVRWYVLKTVLAITLLWNRAQITTKVRPCPHYWQTCMPRSHFHITWRLLCDVKSSVKPGEAVSCGYLQEVAASMWQLPVLYRVAHKKRNSRYSRFFRTLLWSTVIFSHLAG